MTSRFIIITENGLSKMSIFIDSGASEDKPSKSAGVRGCNWSLTKNNPAENLEDFFNRLRSGSKFARAQLERGKSGTPHFQAVVGYANARTMKSMIKNWPGCHIEKARSVLHLWDYCGKASVDDGSETLEGPLEHGLPPAQKNVKGDTKKRNEMILKIGLKKAVDDGVIALAQAP